MSGIYIHIPFCRKNCSYCDFYFSLNKKHEIAFVEALLTELEERKNEIKQMAPLQTVYFGGGTPSYLQLKNLQKILHKITQNFPMAPNPEITLEANPDDITPGNLKAWKNLGINRFSLGVQSFFDDDLKKLNRSHHASKAFQSIELIQSHGFENFNMDLIYGLPGMSLHKWLKNLDIFLSFNIPHLSAYALTVEEGTLLHHQVKTGKIRMPDDEIIRRQFYILKEKLEQAGFEHYEISNFALPGKKSLHNTSYWQGKPYVGLGPSAHSFDGNKTRRWNVANLHRYIQALKSGQKYFESETLTPRDQFNEYILTGLRTANGINLNHIRQNFPRFYPRLTEKAKKLEKENRIIIQNNTLKVSYEYLFQTDGIIYEFFEV